MIKYFIMPHFLVQKEEIKNNYIELSTNDNLFHITSVLRFKTGEKIKFIDEDKNLYLCEIEEIKKNFLKAKIIEKTKSERFLKFNISLVQSILANDAQNLAIANAVQCGIKKIYPVISDNTSISQKALKGKKEKWQKVMIENFKQCERADIAIIDDIKPLREVISGFKKENVLIFAEKYENTTLNNCLQDIDINSEIALVTGPEGGFSEEEFKFFNENKFKLITLGKMILKAPNAITSGIANIVSRLDEC